MFKIVKAEQLSANVYKKVVLAPRVAASCQPGQFIIVRLDETGERIPLTICDYDREAGTVTIVFQPIGVSTSKMVDLKEGDYFLDFVGPLGRPSELVTDDLEEVKKKKVIFIAGGVGTAPVYPQAKWLHEHGIECDIIIGARSKDILIMEEEMSKVGNLYLCTDDGSYGFKGVGTAMLEKLVSRGPSLRSVCSHRTDDHDEIRLSDHEEAGHPDYRQHEPDHGRRNRYVRSLSCGSRRRGQVRLCRRTGV